MINRGSPNQYENETSPVNLTALVEDITQCSKTVIPILFLEWDNRKFFGDITSFFFVQVIYFQNLLRESQFNILSRNRKYIEIMMKQQCQIFIYMLDMIRDIMNICPSISRCQKIDHILQSYVPCSLLYRIWSRSKFDSQKKEQTRSCSRIQGLQIIIGMFPSTVPIDRILSVKNARAWVSMDFT